ncbi:Cytokinesis protein sepH [Cytospora mali]|uniref:non-specific serine/threonine protein kinase n=1 Tax=Cytospora mali TaxID=578113 RepID=A0A194WDI4_CYTMA|nr:Cytokinesis protein sepH [Valsa mali]
MRTGSSNAERAYHAAGGGGVGGGAGGRTPVAARTPRRELGGDRAVVHASGGNARERALQDPGLKDYRLGDCIGKGAFGSVYKGFNWGTGEAVAVKQIKIANLPKSELRMIEAEIDLLKNLHHDNIVKYIGFVKSQDCLNIILEYCENGSLHSICKAYGKFPENLVGVYMTQVLQGLQYLHDQGVIHRDIKGANILTTKDGTVKLADFGVSTSTLAGPDKEAQVVGTPYWMAPEIIQLSGATSASDIWSVGCTVIELLQGRPPYHNLAAMPALFAIVNDDHPPLPEGVSGAARDFLMQCFQKDPNLRVSARKLLKHPWISTCRRSDAPVSKKPANFNQAVEEVKQWNKALKSSETSMRVSSGSDNNAHAHAYGQPATRFNTAAVADPHRSNLAAPAKRRLSITKPKPNAEAFRSPEVADDDNWDNDFATAISPSALHLPHLKPQDNFGGMLSADRLKQFASIDETTRDNWDDNFEGDLQGPRQFMEQDPQEQTIRPTPRRSSKSTESSSKAQQHGHRRSRSKQILISNVPLPKTPTKPSFGNGRFELPMRPETIYREQSTEDFSDLFPESDTLFSPRANRLKKDSSQLMPPPELKSQESAPSNLNLVQMPSPLGSDSSLRRQPVPSRLSAPNDQQPVRRIRSQIEIQKFAEGEDDEDFSDILGPNDTLAEKEESDRGSEDGAGGIMLLSKLSNNSWLGDDEDEDDPFAMIDPEYNDMDLEANIARDIHARLAERVEELVQLLKVGTEITGEERISDVAAELLQLLYDNDDVKGLIVGAHGLLPILELLTLPPDTISTAKGRQDMIFLLLRVVNRIIYRDRELQENLCFVGGIPVITKFAARQFSNEIRLEAADFVQQMYETSTLTLQMFVSCGGISVLAGFLDEDYDSSRDLVLIGVNGIWRVFELQGPTPRNDFCRLFSKAKVLDPLAEILHRVLDTDEKDDLSEFVEGRIVNLFHMFSQADLEVKELIADRAVLKTVLKDLETMTPTHQITMLKFIKNLSMLPTTVEVLHSADAIDYLIDLLGHSLKKNAKHFREISNQVLNTMFNLCRLSKERQEYAAVHGIIPLLLKIMKIDRPPKEFALPILCDMAHSGSKGRRYLWQNKGLDFYVSLLADQYWQTTALDAIFVWLQEETAKVESHLLSGNFPCAIVACFDNMKSNAFAAFDATLLEPLLKVIRLSPTLAASLAKPEMYRGIATKLGHKKPAVRLNLLRLVRTIFDSCDVDMGISSVGGGAQLQTLFDSIQMLEKDQALLVRNLALEIVKSHIESGYSEAKPMGAGSNNGGSGRSRSGGGRMMTNYNTPPPLKHATTAPGAPPMTPPRAPQLRHTESASVVHQVAHTPRRSQTSLVHEQDAMFARPRSRGGEAGLLSPVISVPRRASGDLNAAGRTRLPRGSISYSRPSTSGGHILHHGRSESSLSNKENSTSNGRRGSYVVGSRSGSGGSDASAGSGGSGSSGGLLHPPSSPAIDRERPGGFKRRGSRVPSSELRYGGQEDQEPGQPSQSQSQSATSSPVPESRSHKSGKKGKDKERQHTQSSPVRGDEGQSYVKSSPAQSSINMTSLSLKAQLDASRRPPQGHHVRRVVSSHLTPVKMKEEHKPRPKTAEGQRSSSSKRTDTATVKRAGSRSRLSDVPTFARLSSEKSASPPVAPTPPPSRSNSTASASARPSPIKDAKASSGSTPMQQTELEPSPPKRTRSKLKLRQSPSPPKTTSMSASASSSPSKNSTADEASAQKPEPRSRPSAGPPKRTPTKLRLRRSTPAVDLSGLSESPSNERVDKPFSASHIAMSPSVVDLSKLETDVWLGEK